MYYFIGKKALRIYVLVYSLGDRINFYARKSVAESFSTSNQTNKLYNPVFSSRYVFTTADVKWI